MATEKSKKRPDYFQILSDAVSFTWNHKILWVFGFIMAFFSGGGGNMLNRSINSNNSTPDPEFLRDIAEQNAGYDYNFGSNRYQSERVSREFARMFRRTISQPEFWIRFLIVSAIVLLVLAVIWYLVAVSRVALTKAVLLKKDGKADEIKLGKLWVSAHSYLKNVLIQDILIFLGALPVSLVLVVGTVLGTQICFPICCVSLPILIAWMIFINVLKITSLRILVIEYKSAVGAIQQAFKTMKENLAELSITWLITAAVNFVLFIINVVIALVAVAAIVIPLMMVFIGMAEGMSSSTSELSFGSLAMVFAGIPAFIMAAICGVCCLGIFLALIESPFVVFHQTYWTKIILLLRGEKEK
jgi:hypothetical protein